MLRKVRIKTVPKARTGYQVQGSLANDVPAFGGADYNAYIGAPRTEVSRTLTAVPREVANLEAEGGETVVGDLDGSTMPSFKTIVGPRHSQGGVPLALPDDSFIFSDTKSMRISDPKILKMFNKSAKKGGYTPAELSKQYDINKYRKILQDPNSDKISRNTAEIMIKNYVMKLGALALAQESKKGFPQGIPLIAQPYMEANKIAEEDLIPELAAQKEQEAQMMQAQQQMPQEQMAPQTMPDGQPIAMPQEGAGMMQDPSMMGAPQEMAPPSPEMMQQAPMAAYGMEMGGYDMPFAQDGFVVLKPDGTPFNSDPNYVAPSIPYLPEDIQPYYNLINTPQNELQSISQAELDAWNAANPPEQVEAITPQQRYGGIPRAEYGMPMGGFYPEYAFGGYMQNGGGSKARPKTKEELEKDIASGKVKPERVKTLPDGTTEITTKDGKKVYAIGTVEEQEEDFSNIKKPKVTNLATDKEKYERDICAKIKASKKPIAYAIAMGWISASRAGEFANCVSGEASTKKETLQVFDLEETPSIIPGKKKCKCTDPNTGEEKIFEIDKEEECICESEETTEGSSFQAAPQRDAQFWQQDIINAAGAFGDRMGLRKQMPWEARVDLEEPRPTFLDPTRQLAAQAEQANIASQATAQFAGPQAMGARLNAIQGQGASQAANTLSQINNQNVGIANQFEANQVGVRNQEQAMNQQMANRVFDKNVIAQQQFDNAKRQAAGNMRQAYNTALTNKWKTDALNQMYPNYQVDPLSGGRVQYTPTPKTPTPNKPSQDDIEYIRDLEKAGLSKDAISAAIKARFATKKFGGPTMFEDGGFIYTVFPAVTL